MAQRVALIGLPNTGKSISRKFIYDGERAFVIAPSSKLTHLFTSEGKTKGEGIYEMPKGGKPVQKLDFTINGISSEDFMKKNKVPNFHELVKGMVVNQHNFKIEATGNYILCSDLKYVNYYQHFVSKFMPQINMLFLADFSHWISYILRSSNFRNKKSGGQAFERFWDLAADSLDNIILAADKLRDDLLVYTEYHAQYNEEEDIYKVFVPAGKMLNDKFLPKSYYDVCLHTEILPYEEEPEDKFRYKFVVKNLGRKDGRSMNIFDDIEENGMIPNNIELVDNRIREYFLT